MSIYDLQVQQLWSADYTEYFKILMHQTIIYHYFSIQTPPILNIATCNQTSLKGLSLPRKALI